MMNESSAVRGDGLRRESVAHDEGLTRESVARDDGLAREGVAAHGDGSARESVAARGDGLRRESVAARGDGLMRESVAARGDGLMRESVAVRDDSLTRESVAAHDDGLRLESVAAHDDGLMRESVAARGDGLRRESVAHDEGLTRESVARDDGLMRESVAARGDGLMRESVAARDDSLTNGNYAHVTGFMNESCATHDKGLNARHAVAFNHPPAHPLITASDTLKANHTWYIFTHKKADGDALGSANALISAGLNSGHSVRWFSPDQTLPAGYSYLPHFSEHIHSEKCGFDDPEVLYVFLDCSNQSRSVSGFHTNTNSLNIDHHEDNSLFARVNCVDGKASSTCELLYRLFTAGGWNITQSIAESLYTGLFTDSGSFSFSNTSPLTHIVAGELISLGAEPGHMTDLITQNKTTAGFKLWGCAMSRVRTFGEENIFALTYITLDDFANTGADNTETEGLPAMLMSLIGVKMAVTLTENPDCKVRASFRSREGCPFGAGEIARICGGGGHERAAGATLDGTLDEVTRYIEELLTAKYHERSRTHQ